MQKQVNPAPLCKKQVNLPSIVKSSSADFVPTVLTQPFEIRGRGESKPNQTEMRVPKNMESLFSPGVNTSHDFFTAEYLFSAQFLKKNVTL
jgi:hypothetical protein